MSGKPRLPTNKVLLVPNDALWDYTALRIVLKETRLHRRLTIGQLAAKLSIERHRLRYLEGEQEKWGNGKAADWFLRDWAQILGFILYFTKDGRYRLERRLYSQ